MAVAERPSYDYEATEEAGNLRLEVKSRKSWKQTLAFFIVLPGAFIAWFGIMAMVAGEGGLAFILLLVAAVLIVGSIQFARKKDIDAIEVTPTTLAAHGRTYDLDHVTKISTNAPLGGVFATGATAIAAAAVHQTNRELSITYGTESVTLVRGQTPNSIEAIYTIILGYLFKNGRHYGDVGEAQLAFYETAVALSKRYSQIAQPVMKDR